jgi:hypothetical protein
MPNALQPGQLVALQTLWSQYARRSLDVPSADDRAARLDWAAKNVGRKIASFKDLSKHEARSLIDLLKTANGQQPGKTRKRGDDARRAGVEGRKGGEQFAPQLVSADDLATIESFFSRLGWDRVRFDAWLRSIHSPLARKVNGTRIAPSDAQIKTARDANRVRWALKGMLAARGLWEAR